MEFRQLGDTDLHVSSIGMGCVTFGREIDRETSFQVLDRALERGMTLFDVIPGHQPLYFADHGYATLARLKRVAEQSGRSMVQMALAWTLNQPYISSVLIGARNTDQVDQAFAAEQMNLEESIQQKLLSESEGQ